MASESNKGGGFYGAAPYRSREGLTTRPVTGNDEIQLRIDPMHADLDDEITGLRSQVRLLRNVGGSQLYSIDVLLPIDFEEITEPVIGHVKVAQEIESEAKFQNDFINQLQMTVMKAQAGVKNNMRKLNKSIVQSGSSHVMHVVLFALFCFFVVYFWSKFSRR